MRIFTKLLLSTTLLAISGFASTEEGTPLPGTDGTPSQPAASASDPVNPSSSASDLPEPQSTSQSTAGMDNPIIDQMRVQLLNDGAFSGRAGGDSNAPNTMGQSFGASSSDMGGQRPEGTRPSNDEQTGFGGGHGSTGRTDDSSSSGRPRDHGDQSAGGRAGSSADQHDPRGTRPSEGEPPKSGPDSSADQINEDVTINSREELITKIKDLVQSEEKSSRTQMLRDQSESSFANTKSGSRAIMDLEAFMNDIFKTRIEHVDGHVWRVSAAMGSAYIDFEQTLNEAKWPSATEQKSMVKDIRIINANRNAVIGFRFRSIWADALAWAANAHKLTERDTIILDEKTGYRGRGRVMEPVIEWYRLYAWPAEYWKKTMHVSVPPIRCALSVDGLDALSAIRGPTPSVQQRLSFVNLYGDMTLGDLPLVSTSEIAGRKYTSSAHQHRSAACLVVGWPFDDGYFGEPTPHTAVSIATLPDATIWVGPESELTLRDQHKTYTVKKTMEISDGGSVVSLGQKTVLDAEVGLSGTLDIAGDAEIRSPIRMSSTFPWALVEYLSDTIYNRE